MRKLSVYVTGANGFIGRRVVERLSREYKVVALLRSGSIPGFTLNENVEIVYGDLTDRQSLKKSVPKRVAKQQQVKLVVHISSQATKIKTQGVYAKTKNQSDEIIKKSDIPYVILKPSLVYGEGERGLFSKIRQLAKMLPVVPIFGDGQTKIYPIYVEDFAEIVARVLQSPMTYQKVFDVGAEESITYNALYRQLAPKVIHVPVWSGLLIAKACSFLPSPPIYRDNVLGSTQSTHCRPNPILKLLKFRPRNFPEGMEEMRGESKLKVAVVGLGKMGTLHLSILNTFDKVRIVALIDTNKQLFSTVHSMGIPGNFYTSLTEALRNESIDAVYILTPTFTHLALLKEALQHKLHVFLEKPAFLNMQQLKEAKAIKTKQVVHVGYTLLYSRIYREIKQMIESNKYGKILGFDGKFEHGEVFGPRNGWMFDRKLSGGGVLMNPGPHFFSLIQWFFGTPKAVKGIIKCKYVPELDDEVRVQLNYGKFFGEVELSWSVQGRVTPLNYFKIRFEKAQLTTDGHTITIKSKRRVITRIHESDIVVPGMIFNINPKANGEAYYLESKAFIEEISEKKPRAENTLQFATQSEATIFEVYKNAK
ncbi:MAG: Oxidoreductase [Microgenomates group bacterium GW2011_GWA2_46_7]|nr:MAG: Oxidoreductase [Microgenomates group bacterium GW2011_GWA2_46_7]